MEIHYDYYYRELIKQQLPNVKRIFESAGITGLVRHLVDLIEDAPGLSTSGMYRTNGATHEAAQFLHASLFHVADYCMGVTQQFGDINETSTFGKFFMMVNELTPGIRMIEPVAAHETYHLVMFKRSGENIIQPSPGLAIELDHTEVRGLTFDDVAEAYESMYVTVPQELGFKLFIEETGWHETAGIYVARDRTPTLEGWRFLLVGKGRGKDVLDNVLFYVFLGGDMEATLEEAIKTMDERVSVSTPTMRGTWDRHVRWAINIILYLTSINAEKVRRHPLKEVRDLERRRDKAPVGSTKRKELSERIRRFNPRKHLFIGESIPRPRADAETGTIKVKVRGHWRRYHTGAGRTNTVRKQIRPFWRGLGESKRQILLLKNRDEGPDAGADVTEVAAPADEVDETT